MVIECAEIYISNRLIPKPSRRGFEPPTCPLGGGRAIHCATGTIHIESIEYRDRNDNARNQIEMPCRGPESNRHKVTLTGF